MKVSKVEIHEYKIRISVVKMLTHSPFKQIKVLVLYFKKPFISFNCSCLLESSVF